MEQTNGVGDKGASQLGSGAVKVPAGFEQGFISSRGRFEWGRSVFPRETHDFVRQNGGGTGKTHVTSKTT
jgi:hypothetical protein